MSKDIDLNKLKKERGELLLFNFEITKNIRVDLKILLLWDKEVDINSIEDKLDNIDLDFSFNEKNEGVMGNNIKDKDMKFEFRKSEEKNIYNKYKSKLKKSKRKDKKKKLNIKK